MTPRSTTEQGWFDVQGTQPLLDQMDRSMMQLVPNTSDAYSCNNEQGIQDQYRNARKLGRKPRDARQVLAKRGLIGPSRNPVAVGKSIIRTGPVKVLPLSNHLLVSSSSPSSSSSSSEENDFAAGRDAAATRLSSMQSAAARLLHHRANSPPQVPLPVRMPDVLRLPEECARCILDWTNERFENRAWNASNDWGMELGPKMGLWTNQAGVAREVVLRGDTEAGFRMVQICFQQYQSIIRTEQPPEMLLKTLIVAFYMLQAGPELGASFVRYSASLFPIVLGENHPISRIWHHINALGVEAIRPYLWTILQAWWESLKQRLGTRHKELAVHRLELIRSLHRFGGLPMMSAKAGIQQMVDDMAADVKYWTLDYVMWAKLELVTIYVEAGLDTEAAELLEDIGRRIEATPDGYDIWTQTVYWYLRAQAMENLGLEDEALESYQARYDACLKAVGPDARHTVRALGELERYNRKIGRIEVADQLRTRFHKGWRIVCDRAAAVND
ncbi:Clr5 domain-containing protein [Apiospora rasikravindrae]|uniref:Clr5 domain-containing protein n=1 Tax=Apiospora rasikravindrae TaxID=990691 RepID=A0ABR1TYL8_9PEZI